MLNIFCGKNFDATDLFRQLPNATTTNASSTVVASSTSAPSSTATETATLTETESVASTASEGSTGSASPSSTGGGDQNGARSRMDLGGGSSVKMAGVALLLFMGFLL